jgi:hypothetical protein
VSFYRFTLAELFPHNPRSRGPNDVLMMTFGVAVNNRDQGFYCLTAPIFAGRPLSSDDLRQAAVINGYPGPVRANSRGDFSVGPLEIRDNDDVVILYSGTNISDDPNLALHQDFDKYETKAVSAFYLWMLGAGTDSSWLGDAFNFFKYVLPDDIAKYFDNPVGSLLGIGNDGPCNGLVYRDALKQKGHEIKQRIYTPLSVDKHVGSTGKTMMSKTYSDADYGHDTGTCGMVAITDVTIEITRYEKFPLALGYGEGIFWGPLKDGVVARIKNRPYGIREIAGLGLSPSTGRHLYGLRN